MASAPTLASRSSLQYRRIAKCSEGDILAKNALEDVACNRRAKTFRNSMVWGKYG